MVALFFTNWLIRRTIDFHLPTEATLALSFVAVAFALVGGWLGGELVERLGVGVHRGANPNAPSSISHEVR